MKLTNAEKETIVLFDEESPTASIYTFNEQLKKRLSVLNKQYPDVFRLVSENIKLGCTEYSVPVGLLVIKFMEPLSDEKREMFRQAGRKGVNKG